MRRTKRRMVQGSNSEDVDGPLVALQLIFWLPQKIRLDEMLRTQNKIVDIDAVIVFIMTKLMMMGTKMTKMMMSAAVVLGAGECEGQAESGETTAPMLHHRTMCSLHQCYDVTMLYRRTIYTNVTPSDNVQCAPLLQCYAI